MLIYFNIIDIGLSESLKILAAQEERAYVTAAKVKKLKAIADAKIKEEIAKAKKDIAQISAEADAKVAKAEADHKERMVKIKAAYEERMVQIKAAYEEQMAKYKEKHFRIDAEINVAANEERFSKTMFPIQMSMYMTLSPKQFAMAMVESQKRLARAEELKAIKDEPNSQEQESDKSSL